jgi:hypothetical protein
VSPVLSIADTNHKGETIEVEPTNIIFSSVVYNSINYSAPSLKLLRGDSVSVPGNSLYPPARYVEWRGGGVSQAEPGTSAKGHLADGTFCIYMYQLATQVDRQ